MKAFLKYIAVGASALGLITAAACGDDDTDDGSGGNGGSSTASVPTTTTGGGSTSTQNTGGNGMGETECQDGIDNDGNGFTDCADFACRGKGNNCVENTDALCDDGIDNDGDGDTDCDDRSCSRHPNVTVCTETACDNNMDDDGDGDEDCADFDCIGDAACDGVLEQGFAECSGDETDTDDTDPPNNRIDCADRSCQLTDSACTEETQDECSDGLNQNENTDGDGNPFTDCDDFSCQYSALGGADYCVAQGLAETTMAACTDNMDNDNNSFVDCQDFGCQRSPLTGTLCEGNAESCSDDIDNDGDGFTDCNDNSCRFCENGMGYSAPTCPPCE